MSLKIDVRDADTILLAECVDNGTLGIKTVNGAVFYFLTDKGVKSMMRTVQELLDEDKWKTLRPVGWEDRPPRHDDPDDLTTLPAHLHPETSYTVTGDAGYAAAAALITPSKQDVEVYGRGELLEKEGDQPEKVEPFQIELGFETGGIKSARQFSRLLVQKVVDVQREVIEGRVNKKAKRVWRKKNPVSVIRQGMVYEFSIADVLANTNDQLTNLIMNYPAEAKEFMRKLTETPEVFEEELECL